MKFIHTADLHLGNRMYDIDRNQEFCDFFVFLKNEIEKNEAQALVIAGDVYDKINPSNDAKRIFHNFLASMLNTCCKNIIIIGGNHDSGELLDSEKEILEQLNIHVIGQISNISIEDMIFELKGKDGNAIGICAAIPFASEGELRNYFNEETADGTFSDKAYSILYEKALEAVEKLDNGRNLPLIATGHLYAADLEGRRANKKQNEQIDDGVKALDVVGKLGFVSERVFPKKFDYVALGHIHYPTMVAKNPKIRYSGSPFVMGFDETNQERDILLVEIKNDSNISDESKSTDVKKIKVPVFCEYRRISGDSRTIKNELGKYTDYQEDGKKVYIELYYKAEDGIDIHAELEDLIESLPKCVSVVSWRMQKFNDAFFSEDDVDYSQDFKNLTAKEIFTKLILEKSPVSTEGLTPEEIEKAKNEKLNRYLSVLLDITSEIESNE